MSIILLAYVTGLIVNTYGDPTSTGRDYKSWADVLEEFHRDAELNDFDEEFDIPESWQVDDGQPVTGDYEDE